MPADTVSEWLQTARVYGRILFITNQWVILPSVSSFQKPSGIYCHEPIFHKLSRVLSIRRSKAIVRLSLSMLNEVRRFPAISHLLA